MDAETFARDWETGWNSHDLDRILAHYRDDVVFRSRKAAALAGEGEIVGKAALADYWRTALDRQPDLAFRIEETFAGHGVVTFVYVNQRGMRAAETFWFDDAGRVRMAAACHAPPET